MAALAPSALASAGGGSVAAQERLFDELRVGVLAHDVPILGTRRESGVDLNGELFFVSPVPEDWLSGVSPAWRWLLRPRPTFGVDANTGGYTSQIYVSLAWTADLDNGGTLWPDHAVFLGLSFGPAFNTGHVVSSAPNRLSLGANVLFHSTIEIGYRFTPDLSGSVYFEHSSNAGLARHNDGLDNLGLRVGIRF